MKRLLLIAVIVATTLSSKVSAQQNNIMSDRTPVRLDDRVPLNEPTYQGKVLSYWLRAIRDRDEELMPSAFDAIRDLRGDARAAVPELTRVIAAPFAAIRIGKDSDAVIAGKLYDLEVRSNAVDS